MRFQTLSLIFAALLLVVSPISASALVLYPGIGTTAGTQFEDDDIDFLIKNNTSTSYIAAGDILIAPFEMRDLVDILPPTDPSSPYVVDQDNDELVGVAIIQVYSNANNQITFGEITSDLTIGTTTFLAGTPMVQFYQGGTDLQVSNCTDIASCLAAAMDGTPLFSFSIDALDGDTGWIFRDLSGGLASDPSYVAAQGAAVNVGVANFALNQVNLGNSWDNYFLPQDVTACAVLGCTGDGLADLVGTTNVLGGLGLVNGAFARSDADFTVNVIPEPGTLVLLGMGLLGVAALKKRKI